MIGCSRGPYPYLLVKTTHEKYMYDLRIGFSVSVVLYVNVVQKRGDWLF